MDITKYDVIRGPVVTGKAYRLNRVLNQLVIEVHRHANKPLIKEAIEKIFNVKVEEVRTATRKPRTRKVGKHLIKGTTTKKAIITLKDGYKLDLSGNGITPVVEGVGERGEQKEGRQ
jgi:large subunit ribosomal protein L23